MVILLFDDSAFEFHREGEGTVVEGEIVGEQGEALDGFVLGEVSGQAGDFVFDEGIGARMRGHFCVGGRGETFFRKFGGESGGINDKESDYKFALVADDHGVEYEGTGLENIFDGLRRDKFAGGSFEQIFFAIGDEEIVIFVEIADVAGFEPAIRGEDFARRFRILVIALHDAGAFGENFAVIGDADLHVGDGAAGTTHAIVWVIVGEDGRSFCEAVTLIDGNTDGPEKFSECLRKRRAAGENQAQVSAGAGANFGINQTVGDGPFQFQQKAAGFFARAPTGGFPGGLHSEIKNLAFGSGGLTSLLHQAGINFFEETRNGSDDGGTDFREGLRDVFDDGDVGDGAALKEVEIIQHAPVDVGEREKRNGDIAFGMKNDVLAGIGDVGGEVGVREHDAFGLASGAGSVNDGCELRGNDVSNALPVRGDVRGAGSGEEGLVAKEFFGEDSAGAGNDDVLDGGELSADLEKFFQLREASDEDDLRAAMIKDVGHAVGRFVEVDGDGDCAGTVDGEIGGVPFGTIGSEQADAIAGFDAEFDETIGQAGDAAEKFLGGDGFPTVSGTVHLGAQGRMLVEGAEESGCE